jgi:hypothetical protein
LCNYVKWDENRIKLVGVLVGVGVGMGAAKSELRRATKASSPPPNASWAPPVVPGKSFDPVNPAT